MNAENKAKVYIYINILDNVRIIGSDLDNLW